MKDVKIKKQLELHLFLKMARNKNIAIKAIKKSEKINSYRTNRTFLKLYTTKLQTKNTKFPLNLTFCKDKTMLYTAKPNLIVTEQVLVNKDSFQKVNFTEEKISVMLTISATKQLFN